MRLRKFFVPFRPVRRSPWVVAIMVVAAVPVLVGTVRAAIPDGAGKVTGCYALSGGSLRVIDTATTPDCRADEHRLEWSQQGPPGAPGTPGTPGTNGVSGWERVVSPAELLQPGEEKFLSQDCPAGKKPLGGGVLGRTIPGGFFPSLPAPIAVRGSFPSDSGWFAWVKNDSGGDRNAFVGVICATV
jgi:hypothetical protein